MKTSDVRAYLVDRLGQVETRIRAACARAGRPRSAVTLVAVTKSVGPTVATLVTELGVLDLGESRPQELWHKAEPLPPAVRWHLVGHLQRNKIERTLRRTYLVHSVDSVRLLDALEVEAQKLGRPLDVLLEVNASREANKHGFAPEEILALAPRLTALKNVRVHGMMTLAAHVENPEFARGTFAEVRQLRDQLQKAVGPSVKLEHLSMGMTNDFEVAIEEGATLIRVGSAIFDGVTAVGAQVIALTDHPDGIVLPIRAQPNARKAQILGEYAGSLRVAITAPPEDGRANAALTEWLRELLGVKRSQIALLSGATGRNKKILIRGVAKAELQSRIESLLPS